MMSFVIRMAAREIRSSWQRLLFFFVCIAIGVAAIIVAALGHPERARRHVAGGAVAHRRRHPADEQ